MIHPITERSNSLGWARSRSWGWTWCWRRSRSWTWCRAWSRSRSWRWCRGRSRSRCSCSSSSWSRRWRCLRYAFAGASGSEDRCDFYVSQRATEYFDFVDLSRKIKMSATAIIGSAADSKLRARAHGYACRQRADDNAISVKLRDCPIISEGNVSPLVERRNERRADDVFLDHAGQLVELEDQNV